MRSRYARKDDVDAILDIVNQARLRLRAQGIDQWQNGYPDRAAIEHDIECGYGHVAVDRDVVVGYAAIIFDVEPTYAVIDGQWLTDEPYVVVHRMAVSDAMLRRGVGSYLFRVAERKALRKGVTRFRIDTHLQNHTMRNLIRKHNFTLCGVVQVRDGKRLAYEKPLIIN